MKTRRVGTATCGLVMIVFGVLFFLHLFIPDITYRLIFDFWPLVLIFLGGELLLSCIQKEEVVLKYDAGAIALMFLLALFAMGMGLIQFCMEQSALYGRL